MLALMTILPAIEQVASKTIAILNKKAFKTHVGGIWTPGF
jgi:hypothetical protein